MQRYTQCTCLAQFFSLTMGEIRNNKQFSAGRHSTVQQICEEFQDQTNLYLMTKITVFLESQNTSNDEDPQLLWTTCSTTIIVKNVSLMPSINLASFSLKPLPLALSVLGKVSFHASYKLLL